nr:unnamed protein product [Callosobruchus analis]
MYAIRLFFTEKEKEIEKLRIRKQYNRLNQLGVIKKDKGITGAFLRRIIFEDCYKCLFNQVNLSINESLIRSKKHEVYTISQKKVALTSYDDKRIVNYVYTDTLPWGYQKIIKYLIHFSNHFNTHSSSRRNTSASIYENYS